jgi:hypothetical protein
MPRPDPAYLERSCHSAQQVGRLLVGKTTCCAEGLAMQCRACPCSGELSVQLGVFAPCSCGRPSSQWLDEMRRDVEAHRPNTD